MNNPISSHNDIRTNIYNLFKNIEHNHKDIRLIGVTLSNLVNEEVTNISFFEYIKTIENKSMDYIRGFFTFIKYDKSY